MIKVQNFHPRLEATLPETYALLRSSNLTLHPRVSRLILHGSRGLANRPRFDSDIDLSLIVDISKPEAENLELLKTIHDTTYDHWALSIPLDLAVIFDIRQCKLSCFDQNTWDPGFCSIGGIDCFGLYKIGKGFNGLVTNAGIQVERMYPCLKIWERT